MKKKIGIEARSETLYVRIRPSTKNFVKKRAKKLKLSEAAVVENALQREMRIQDFIK